MRATSALILVATVLTGFATAMPSSNEIRSDGVQARTPLYGPRPIRIAEPEDDEPAVIEARTPLYGPRPIRIADAEE